MDAYSTVAMSLVALISFLLGIGVGAFLVVVYK